MPIHVGETYQHYKGNYYRILALAKHTETLEDLVVYEDLNHEHTWVRPYSMFVEFVELENGKQVPRFKKITNQQL